MPSRSVFGTDRTAGAPGVQYPMSNPQFADKSVAEALAGRYGGQVTSSKPATGPYTWPEQYAVNVRGADYNAGLLQQNIDKYGEATARQMFEDERRWNENPANTASGRLPSYTTEQAGQAFTTPAPAYLPANLRPSMSPGAPGPTTTPTQTPGPIQQPQQSPGTVTARMGQETPGQARQWQGLQIPPEIMNSPYFQILNLLSGGQFGGMGGAGSGQLGGGTPTFQQQQSPFSPMWQSVMASQLPQMFGPQSFGGYNPYSSPYSSPWMSGLANQSRYYPTMQR